MSRVAAQLERQRASNASAVAYFDAFGSHRERTSRLIAAARAPSPASLCVLGAGNAYDLALEDLLAQFERVHLVDIDADAVARARARLPDELRPRLVVHAPLDLSGMFHDIERWQRMQVTPQELMRAPGAGAKRIADALPGPFDVVASTCLLTQLQLSLLMLLGEQHQLFGALRELLTLTHLRTLAALTKPEGRALLITDLCEAAVFPAARPRGEDDLAPLMAELVAAGHVVHSSHPELIRLTLRHDPLLSQAFASPQQSEPWLWQNGPERRFLVYGLTMERQRLAAATSDK